jgi:hypothetical protein
MRQNAESLICEGTCDAPALLAADATARLPGVPPGPADG